MLCHIFHGYLKFLEKTTRVEIQSPELFTGHNVVGFWHEDSFAMNLVLKKLAAKDRGISVLVTGDPRGEYIQYLLEKNGGKAVRLDYSSSQVGVMKELIHTLKQEGESVAVAMDGPLGPRYVPKKVVYALSQWSQTNLLRVSISYSHRIALKRRWDHYRIPLPFTKITVTFTDYGIAET